MQEINTKNMTVRILITLVVIGVLFWAANNHRTVTVDSGYHQVMGTFARIVVTAQNKKHAQQAISLAFDKINHIEDLMSDYDPDSQLSQVNREAFDRPIPVDAELFELLTASVEYSKLSDGAFDVTVGPVVQLWRKAKTDQAAPTPEALAAAKAAVGYQNLLLDAENQTVRFMKQGMFIDLGGIAKGYAVDKAVEILRNAGLKGGMVDIGGNLKCFGIPANNTEHWYIGLQDPENEDSILLKLILDDRAVATSGDYRRFVTINGEKHSHIINPATADSAQSLSSVTIITADAMAADALSTAVSVMGDEKGMALIETINDTEALLIEANQTKNITKSSGVGQFIQRNNQ